jgi:flagellin
MAADEIGQAANLAAAINKHSDQSGVTAVADPKSGELTLTAKDGRDIQLGTSGDAAKNTTAQDDSITALGTVFGTAVDVGSQADGTTAAVAGDVAEGNVKLTSTGKDGITISGGQAADIGFTAGTVDPETVSQVNSVASIDISSAKGAQDALEAIDGALKSINDSRSDLGALQNRFGSVVSGLATTTENLSASRSRITDTDFASETANMTRSQILQQAGTAMLAQANQLPNSVMSLLRG